MSYRHQPQNAARLVAVGRETIAAEAQALLALEKQIDQAFAQAVEICLRVKQAHGRLIISGVGKSGHIANKIAATLASTGNPAYFVHPAEAAHGDMGMITARDALVLLSKSGESTEFIPILDYAVRHGIESITMTANIASLMAKQSTIVLALPKIGESPITDTNAPTNSTTMMLALGDALAMALLDAQGFTHQDFALLHPGGQLGAQLLSLAQVMRQGNDIPLVDHQASVSKALLEMTKKRLGCVGLTDQAGKLCGIFTDGDLRRCLEQYEHIHTLPIIKVATLKPHTSHQDMRCANAITLMESKQITVLFVTQDDQPIGVVHLHDLLQRKVL